MLRPKSKARTSKKAKGRAPVYGGPAVVPGSLPYGYRLRAKLDVPRDHPMPPAWVLDEQAEESVYGPKRDRRSPVCTSCYTRKSASGTCFC